MSRAYSSALIAHYSMTNPDAVGEDCSGHGLDAKAMGPMAPYVTQVNGRTAAVFTGKSNGNSYLELPKNILEDVSDNTGFTMTAWVNPHSGSNMWERIMDFGRSGDGPFIYLTRTLHGSLFCDATEVMVDAGRQTNLNQWMHVAFTITGTKCGTMSSAGPKLYINGELEADGTISQTASGQYASLRAFFDTFDFSENYTRNYIGHSQFKSDADFSGAIYDLRLYKEGLAQEDILEIMCNSLDDMELLILAKKKFLRFESSIITKNVTLPDSLMDGRVALTWKSSNPDVFSHDGKIGAITEPSRAVLTATLSRNGYSVTRDYYLSVLPDDHAPYTLTVRGNQEVLDISPTLYGLFFEDINNSADGGIYAEMVKNRSFEAFKYYVYNSMSGENGRSTGRHHTPLAGWSGELRRVYPRSREGLNQYFGCKDPDVNRNYITVSNGVDLYNRGFTDDNNDTAMKIEAGKRYQFTIWAKSRTGGSIRIQLEDSDYQCVSNQIIISVPQGGPWTKYGEEEPIYFIGTANCLGQLKMTFTGEISIDMVSLFPEDVWGLHEEPSSPTAHTNYMRNPNYRLRRDMVEKLIELHPRFLRFPGGCISEGSYIWDNVYDWKDSVGPVELRKENYNVWGYMMTLGLGYMEYFQLAEDLNATPLPVMACGVLCQARSDYANPAGGELREKYIKNFTDLIDFAISTDFEHNKWACVRRDMGHEAPFDLHLLGVGNENWGEEFYANFQVFKKEIDDYVAEHYPGYDLTIISTVGAQADDVSYQEGWKFLSGNYKEPAEIAFTDGQVSWEEEVEWYPDSPDYMDTIADEHFYRSNEYLLHNEDRYNYYYRAYDENGQLVENKTSKVFVGEYASSEKNTLTGAVAEAAIMTGFERNSDVVRLAAYAPLFNKVLTDRTYRWTPDLIWFDNETVWRTPNYYVQQMFAKYLGNKLLDTSFYRYSFGEKIHMKAHGGFFVASGKGEIHIRTLKVISNRDDSVIVDVDFRRGIPEGEQWKVIPGSEGFHADPMEGLILRGQEHGLNGLYYDNWGLSNYRVEAEAVKWFGPEGFHVGVGAKRMEGDQKSYMEYVIGYDYDTENGPSTGLKVVKKGVEAYKLGDFSNSTCAGNLRACNYEPIEDAKRYYIRIDFGGTDGKTLTCSYSDGQVKSRELSYKLDYYNFRFYTSATSDDEHVYIKVVSADQYDKGLRIDLEGLTVEDEGDLITLTAPKELASVPNVNSAHRELVVPEESRIPVDKRKNAVWLTIKANSVNVVVLKKKK